jgi:hypothetical protein
MAENIDDLTIEFYQDDRVVIKELQKIVLTRGNWTTIMYMYQDLNKKTNEYEAPKVSIRRYQKRGGIYKQQSKFNISSAKQANEIAAILVNWFPETEEGKAKRLAKMEKDAAHAKVSQEKREQERGTMGSELPKAPASTDAEPEASSAAPEPSAIANE